MILRDQRRSHKYFCTSQARCTVLVRLHSTKQDPHTQQHTKMSIGPAGCHLLCEGADNLSRDVQEEDGADEGQCQDEDNEGVAVDVESRHIVDGGVHRQNREKTTSETG
jgi:hypothetical protein